MLSKPDVILKDYNHHPILIAAMAEVEIEFQERHLTTTLYIHSDCICGTAPFLLGTNAIIAVGLMTVPSNVLACGGSNEPSTVLPASVPFRLVRTKSVPGHHGVLARAQVDLPLEGDTIYF